MIAKTTQNGEISLLNPLKDLFGENRTEISKDHYNALQAFNDDLKNGINKTDAIKKNLKDIPDNLLNIAKKSSDAGVDLSQFAIKEELAAIKAKALNIALNGLASIAITAAINFAINKWNENNVTLEEAKEKVSSLAESYNSLKSEIDALDKKQKDGTLTPREEAQLSFLRERLKLEEKYLELAKQEEIKEELGDSRKITDWFDKDNYLTKTNREFASLTPWVNGFDKDNNNFNYNKYKIIDSIKELAEMSSEEIDKYLNDGGIDIYSDVYEKYLDYQKEILNIQDRLSDTSSMSPKQISQYQEYLSQYTNASNELKELLNKFAFTTGNVDYFIFDESSTLSDVQSMILQLESMDGFSETNPIYLYLKMMVLDKGNFIKKFTDGVPEAVQSQFESYYSEMYDKLTPEQRKLAMDLEIHSGVMYSYDEFISKLNGSSDAAETFNTSWDEITKHLDKLQDGLKTSTEAFAEYKEKGYLTLDTLQSLINADENYIKMLTVENGQIKINEEEYKNQTALQLLSFKTKLMEAAASEIEAAGNAVAAGETTNYSEKLLENTSLLDENTQAAIDNAVAKGLSIQEANDILNKYQGIWDAALNGYNTNYYDFMGISKGTKTGKEKLEQFMEHQEALLDAGVITFQDYSDAISKAIDDAYKKGKISAKEYYTYVKTLKEKELELYDKALSAINNRLDKEIKDLEKLKKPYEDQNKNLEKQLDNYDKILSAINNVYDTQINAYKEEQDAIQDKIDALKDANDEEDRSIALANAKLALEKAQQQRTRLVYTEDQGFVYRQDEQAIRDARKELKDVELENTIADLEKEKEAFDDLIEKLEEYKEKWSEIADVHEQEVNKQLAADLFGADWEKQILDGRTEDIEEFKNNYLALQEQIDDNTKMIESYEEKIEYYNNLKEQWEDLTNVYQTEIEKQCAAELFGNDWEEKLLKGRLTEWENFKNDYARIQKEISDATKTLSDPNTDDGSGLNTGGAPAGDNNATTTNKNNTIYSKYKLVDDNGIVKGTYNTVTEAQAARQSLVVNDAEKFLKEHGYNKNTPIGKSIYQAQMQQAMLRYDIQSFAKGGVVSDDNDFLSSIAKKNGEDSAVFVRGGERILTPVQNEMWEKWTSAIPTLVSQLDNIVNFNGVNTSVMPRETNINQHITLSLPNVTNNSGAEYVIEALKRLPVDAVQRVNQR